MIVDSGLLFGAIL